MPTFDFKCPKCGHKWEANVFIPVNDAVIQPTCPQCKGEGEKQPSAPSFIIKGFSAKNGYSK
jgi:putative FmdB family regulatory protein